MESASAKCARPNTVATDKAFEVGSYHCVCVLESDVDEGHAFKPAKGVNSASAISAPADPYAATASFDAIGESCVELLLPMAKMVRALQPDQILKVVTDDPAAREDLGSWCRMTGNELLERVKGKGADTYFIKRGHAM
jgi:TusA-related sulfurtransferase